jgi:acylpyruvate hydrolase
MKIFCIGRNYAEHAKELNNAVPTSPIIFMKPPTALLQDNQPFYYPEFSKDIHYELEIVLRVCKNGKNVQPAFASTYYDQIALGIDFTARDLQEKCKEKGHPWEIAKAFDHSAVLSKFTALPANYADGLRFSLLQDQKKVQDGNTKDLIFTFDQLICHISKYFTLQQGDLIYTGTPSGVGPVQIGNILEGFLGDEKLLHCEVK